MNFSVRYVTFATQNEKKEHLMHLWAVANTPKLKHILERLGAISGESVNFQTLGALCKAYASTQRVLCFAGVDIYKETLLSICRWCKWCVCWDGNFKQITSLWKRLSIGGANGKAVLASPIMQDPVIMGKYFSICFGIETPQELERLGETIEMLVKTPAITLQSRGLKGKPESFKCHYLLTCAYSYKDLGAHA